jgi:hypothetical protein
MKNQNWIIVPDTQPKKKKRERKKKKKNENEKVGIRPSCLYSLFQEYADQNRKWRNVETDGEG